MMRKIILKYSCLIFALLLGYINKSLSQDLFTYQVITEDFISKLEKGQYRTDSKWSFFKDTVDGYPYLVTVYQRNEDCKYIVGDEKMVCFSFEKEDNNCLLRYSGQNFQFEIKENRIKKMKIYTHKDVTNIEMKYDLNELVKVKNKEGIENNGLSDEYLFYLIKQFNTMLTKLLNH